MMRKRILFNVVLIVLIAFTVRAQNLDDIESFEQEVISSMIEMKMTEKIEERAEQAAAIDTEQYLVTPEQVLQAEKARLMDEGRLEPEEGEDLEGVSEQTTPSESSDEDVDSSQAFEGFNLQGYSNDGEKSWDLEGDTANFEGEHINITNVDANAYGDDPMHVTAKTGEINRKTGEMTLKKDVVMTTKSGAQLTTDSLNWEREKDLVTTDDPVKITEIGMVATGIGARAKPGLKIAQLNRNVKVEIDREDAIQDGEKIVATCDGPMEIDQQNNIAIFNDNVVVIQGDRTIESDRMEMYIHPESRQIKEVICIGNVIITQGENKSYSSRAVLDGATRKLTLSGRPKLILQTEEEAGGFAGFGDM